MNANMVIILQNPSNFEMVTNATVTLKPSYPSSLSGEEWLFSNRGDGTYLLDMSTRQSCIGTIWVNGVAQSNFTDVLFLTKDILDHIGVSGYDNRKSPDFDTLHGMESGAVVDTVKSQTLENKTFVNPTTVSAAAITSGTLDVARLPAGIPDDKLVTPLDEPDLVAGSAIELATTPGLEDNTGLRIKASDGVELTGSGLKVLLSASSGLGVSGAGLTIDTAGAGGIEIGAGGLTVKTGSASGLSMNADDGLFVDNVDSGGLENIASGLRINIDKAANALSLWTNIQDQPHWGPDPYNFDADDYITAAISKLDTVLHGIQTDVNYLDTADKRVMLLYSQSQYDFNSAADIGSITDLSNTFTEGNITYRKELFCPINLSPGVHYLSINFLVYCPEGTGSIKFRLVDRNGTTAMTDKVFSSVWSAWTPYWWTKSLPLVDSGIYWLEMYMKGSSVATAKIIGLTVAVTNHSFITMVLDQPYFQASAQNAGGFLG